MSAEKVFMDAVNFTYKASNEEKVNIMVNEFKKVVEKQKTSRADIMCAIAHYAALILVPSVKNGKENMDFTLQTFVLLLQNEVMNVCEEFLKQTEKGNK